MDLFSCLRPTNAERLAVLDQVASLEPRLEDIKHQRNLAIAYLHSLQLEKSLLEAEIMRRKELLHPIKSLPTHLLTRIFELYLETWPKSIAKLQIVSKDWNYIVRNSPTLWTTLNVENPFHDHHTDSWKRYIDACVLRSKTLPLKVRFRLDGYTRGEVNALYTEGNAGLELLNYLTILSCSRWVSLEYTWQMGWRNLEFNERFDKLREIIRQARCLQDIYLRDSCDIRYTILYCGRLEDHKPAYGSSLRRLHIRNFPWEVAAPQDPLPSVQELTIQWDTSKPWNDLVTSEVSWLSLFPSVRRLTLRAGSRPVHLDDLSLFDTIPYAPSELRVLKIVGPVPPWVLKNVRLLALEKLRIHENRVGEHVLEEERCVAWFKVIHDFGYNFTSQIVCLGPDFY
jgi:hypothetical protein